VILPVHFAGHPAAMDEILAAARRFGLAVLEDAAHSMPASFRGDRVGSMSEDDGVERAVAFSFYATKNLTTGEGGALVGSQAFIDEAKLWSLHGMERDAWKRYGAGGNWHYEVTRPGFKYNMTDPQAAMGCVQLDRLEEFDDARLRIAHTYTAEFAGMPGLRTPAERDHVTHAWHLYALRLNLDELTIGRDEFIEELGKRNIATSVHFIPIHRHAFYRDKYGFTDADLPRATKAFTEEISLPIYPGMSRVDVYDVIAAVRDIHDAHLR
jgi:dTDP-4-amino-4,6-dideoxygalactose transaminase